MTDEFCAVLLKESSPAWYQGSFPSWGFGCKAWENVRLI